LIPVEGFAMFKEKGGLQSVIDWLPLEAFANALSVLRDYRTELMNLLYQVTGMSDIMRGQSTKGATATEQALKAKFASTRVQEFQNEFARFASDTQKIKAEIISLHFDPQSIMERSNAQYMTGPDPMASQRAVALIKSSIIQYRVEVKPESVAMADMAAVKQERSEFLLAVSQFLQSSAPITQAAPWSGPFLLQILQWAVASFRGGATIEGVLDQMVTTANQQLQAAQSQPPPPDPKLMQVQAKMQMDQQKAQMDMQVTQQKSQIELHIKQVEAQMKQQQMQMDLLAQAFGIKMEQQKLQMGMEVAQQKAQVDTQKAQMDGEISVRKAESEIQMDAKRMALEDQKGSMEHERAIADHEMSMEQADAQHKQKLQQAKEKPAAKGGDK
jgi:hypothetical protein